MSDKDEIVEGIGCAMHDVGSCGIAKKLQEENSELQSLFNLRWQADQRAIKMWQAANPGNDSVWPDRADLVVWMLEKYEGKAVEAEKSALECTCKTST